MHLQPFRFSTRDILEVFSCIPLAIGIVVAFFGVGAYLELVILDDPLSDARRTVIAWSKNSSGILGRLFFISILGILHDGLSWIITVLAVSILTYWRLRISRNLAVAICFSIPIVEVLTGFPSTLFDSLDISRPILVCISVAGAIVPSIIMLFVIRQIRIVLDMHYSPRAIDVSRWKKVSMVCVAGFLFALSAFGWRLLLLSA